MDIFGIGPTELVFIILIALIILGPKDMQKAGRTIGRWLRDMASSDGWRAFRDTSREIRNLPNRLMREANLEDIDKDVGKIGKEIKEATDVKGFGTWANPAAARSNPHRSKPVPAEASESQDSNPELPPQPPEKSNKESNENA
jgi:sec-independent protein translocase protein TatB